MNTSTIAIQNKASIDYRSPFDLPVELLLKVFDPLGLKELARCMRVSKSIRATVCSDVFWKAKTGVSYVNFKERLAEIDSIIQRSTVNRISVVDRLKGLSNHQQKSSAALQAQPESQRLSIVQAVIKRAATHEAIVTAAVYHPYTYSLFLQSCKTIYCIVQSQKYPPLLTEKFLQALLDYTLQKDWPILSEKTVKTDYFPFIAHSSTLNLKACPVRLQQQFYNCLCWLNDKDNVHDESRSQILKIADYLIKWAVKPSQEELNCILSRVLEEKILDASYADYLLRWGAVASVDTLNRCLIRVLNQTDLTNERMSEAATVLLSGGSTLDWDWVKEEIEEAQCGVVHNIP